MRREQKEAIKREKELKQELQQEFATDPAFEKHFKSLDQKHEVIEHYFSFESGKELVLAGTDLVILPDSNVERATNLVDVENLEKVAAMSVGTASTIVYRKINPNELALALYDTRDKFLVYKI